MIFRFLSHYLQRSWELGPWGTLQRVWLRTANWLALWGQSWWWGRKARRRMSNAALLARTRGGWHSVDALLDHLVGRSGSSFMLPHDSPSETAAILDRDCPEYLSALFAAADACCRNELCLLGKNFSLGQNIDWLKDPVTGWRWPLVYRRRVEQYLWSQPEADPILVWELNRHQHFITLGTAFWLTNDERYVDAFNSQVHSWIETNPVQHGVNWFVGLEVSLRLIAWTVAFQFFRSSPAFQQKTAVAFLKSIWQQADFLSKHLQTATTPGVVPNNHIIAELTGLVLVASAFPEFGRAAAWRDTALQLLSQEAASQTHTDGVNKEQATGYHRFVADLLLLIVARTRRGALPPVADLEHTLERMLEYVLGTVTPAGAAPMWGDSSSTRALHLAHNKDVWDFRPLLSAGAALFARPDWKYVAGRFDEEAVWLLGTDGLNIWEQLEASPPKWTSRDFPEAGLYVIRDAWATTTDVGYLRCGPFGLGGEMHCAHSHCDLLSFVLHVHGQPLLVDSGTYTYGDPWRDRFRLTSAHNTVMIDGHDQAIPVGRFRWKYVPEAKCTDWNGERVRASLPCVGDVTFSRELAHPRPGVWELVDRFTGRNEHMMEWFFHFAPGLELDIHQEGHIVTVLQGGRSLLILNIPDGGVRLQVRDSWYSEQYGVKQRNRELYAQWHGQLHRNGVPFRWRFQRVD